MNSLMSKKNKKDIRKRAQKMPENINQIQADPMQCELTEKNNYIEQSNRVESLEKRCQKKFEDLMNFKEHNYDEIKNLSNAIEDCKENIKRIDIPNRQEIFGRLLALDDMISGGEIKEDHPLMQLFLNKMRDIVTTCKKEDTSEINPPMNDGGPIPTHSTQERDVDGKAPKCEDNEIENQEERKEAVMKTPNSLESQRDGETLPKNDEESDKQKESNDEKSHEREAVKEDVILDQNNVAATLKKSLIQYLEEKISELETKLETKVEKLRNVISKEEENKSTHGSEKGNESIVTSLEKGKEEIEATGSIKHDNDEYSNVLRDLDSRISNLEKYGFTEWKEGSIFGNEDHMKELQELDIRLARLEHSSESEEIRGVAMRIVHLEREHMLMQKHVQKIEKSVWNLLPQENFRVSMDGRSMNYDTSNPTQYKESMQEKHFAPRMQADEPLEPRLEEFLQQTALLNRTVQAISNRLNSLESQMKLGKKASEPTDKDRKTTTPSWSSFQPTATATPTANSEILGKALFRAADQGRLKDVRDLLNAGASVDFRSRSRCTALHAAAAHGHAEVVELLLASGANASARNVGGLTPLHLAAQEGHAACLRALLRAGAPLEVVTRGGLTPLQLALKWGSREAAEVLHLAEGGSTEKRE